MRRKRYLFFVVLIFLVTVGCGSKREKDGKEVADGNAKTIMNVSLDNVSTIDLYVGGEMTTVQTNSEDFLKLATIIEEAEVKGGADLTDSAFIIPAGTTYAEYSEKEKCRVYIVNFKEKQAVSYGDYSSAKPNEDAIFIIPEKNVFGIIINDEEGNPKCYETFMDVEKDIFQTEK